MKREEIKKIFPDATDDQLKAVMDLNGVDIEKAKGNLADIESELKEKKEAFDKLSDDFNSLKESNAGAEEYKTKFENLQREIKEKEEQAEKDRIAKEKSNGIAARFLAVTGEKKFAHDAIKADYLKKFSDALESKDFEGKSDAEIFHSLTKDDSAAFEGVKSFQLAGGTNKKIGGSKQYESKADIMAIKDAETRQRAIRDNIKLFTEKE